MIFDSEFGGLNDKTEVKLLEFLIGKGWELVESKLISLMGFRIVEENVSLVLEENFLTIGVFKGGETDFVFRLPELKLWN